eukprot:2554403-Rhodomonas_salina.1
MSFNGRHTRGSALSRPLDDLGVRAPVILLISINHDELVRVKKKLYVDIGCGAGDCADQADARQRECGSAHGEGR